MKPLAQQTLYEILEVPPDAPPGDIEAAVARARETYGPGSIVTYSLMAPDEAELMTRRIEEAGATLLDPAARARYDARLGGTEVARANGTTAASPSHGATPAFLPPVIPALQLAAVEPAVGPEAHAGGQREDDDAPEAAPRDAVERPDGDEREDRGGDDDARAAPAEVAPASHDEEPPQTAAAPDAPPPARAPAPIRLDREIPAPPPALTPPPGRGLSLPAPPAPAAVNRDTHVVIPEATAWSGEVLRQIREARGISVQQISERTKVVRHHIENIEGDRYGLLPAPVYLRGILLGIARELRLDGQKVARSYLERMEAGGQGGGGPAPRR